ncbi:MAG TPA: hypothetical protein VEQ37_05285 [Actinomycetota bacterium]|nr:hypothetical protein [Actinomycetota bacterium]
MSSKLIVVVSVALLVGVSCTSSPASKPISPQSPRAGSAAPATHEPSPSASASGYHPTITPADFVQTIDNPNLPWIPGTTYVFRGIKDGESQRDEVVVTHRTKLILGVTCLVVTDTATHAGRLLEKTEDWYAQDKNGNVWYFGEDTASYDEKGHVESREGSWEAGVDGAEPGIVMPAHPQVTESHRQEFYQGQAEDMFWIVSLARAVKVPYGKFQNVMETLEWTPLEPKVIDTKFYAAGVGVILEVAAAGDKERAELASVTTP